VSESKDFFEKWFEDNIEHYHLFKWKIKDLAGEAFLAGCLYIMDAVESRKAELAQAKCLCDTCQNVGCRGVEIPFRGKWTMHECEGYSAPEPFGRGKV